MRWSSRVWKVSLFSFKTAKRIKGLKKQFYSGVTLGSLTNSVCISVPAASFILFFGVTGQVGSSLHLRSFLHTALLPLPWHLWWRKEQWLFFSLINFAWAPWASMKWKCTVLSYRIFYSNENLEMEACALPPLVLQQSFSCGLGNAWRLPHCCSGYCWLIHSRRSLNKSLQLGCCLDWRHLECYLVCFKRKDILHSAEPRPTRDVGMGRAKTLKNTYF